ncbi:unnamed protein product, partial [Gordionus sp. m RMFG-2023]
NSTPYIAHISGYVRLEQCKDPEKNKVLNLHLNPEKLNPFQKKQESILCTNCLKDRCNYQPSMVSSSYSTITDRSDTTLTNNGVKVIPSQNFKNLRSKFENTEKQDNIKRVKNLENRRQEKYVKKLISFYNSLQEKDNIKNLGEGDG